VIWPDRSRPQATNREYPLAGIVAGGIKPGQKLFMNVTRVSGPLICGKGGYDVDSWVSFCSVHDVDRLAEVHLAE